MYTRDTVVALQPFTRQQEGEDVIIGNPAKGVFLAVPPDVVEVLDQLAQGKSVGEVSDLYLQRTGETPDLADLLTHLESKGLVEPRSGGPVTRKKAGVPIREITFHFGGLPQSIARSLFSYPVFLVEAILLILACCAIIRYPSLMPMPGDLVFDHQRAFSWTILTIFTYFGIFLHELAHLVAARAVGVNSRMGISYRLWFLVAETDLTGLWSVARTQRYLPMLAGLVVDTTLTSILILLLLAEHQHLFSASALAVHLLRAMIFTNLIRISWQFFLFVRTDLYFVAVTFLNCKNLLVDTRVFIRNHLARLFPRIRSVDQSGIPAAEQRAIRAYAAIFVAGRIWALVTLIWVTLPVLIGYWDTIVPAVRAGYSANPSEFLDALSAATYFLTPTVAGFVVWAGAHVRPKGA